MSVFSHRDFDDHEEVVFVSKPAAGLRAIIAVHNTNRGPSLGGCRMWPYASDEEALHDVLRLSRGMTYKSAVANLDIGGGKSVIIGNPRTEKTEVLLRAMAHAIDGLGGRYIAAEDSGTSVADMKLMAEETAHVAGILDRQAADGGIRDGDPSPATALGTFVGLGAAVRHGLGRNDLEGLRIAIQGVGSVGFRLARLLHQAGAKLWVTDIYRDQLTRAVDAFGATAVAPDEIYGLDVDVFAPCAMGAVLNDLTIPHLRARIVAGAANNQLSEARHGTDLMERDILYAPDYVINAGGIIDVWYERRGQFDRDVIARHIEGIGGTLSEIFTRAHIDGLPTNIVADQVAEERFRKAGAMPAAGPGRAAAA
ncbi:MAG: Glu/Leu/Phe/Val dehydrogenase [Rhodospirillales bacterium]|nr:Glu/Leu/Phe/Val dehydrogenase [Rhodospirillales bacterium]